MLLGFKPNQNDSVFSVFFLKSKSLSKSYFFSCQQDKEILEVCGFVGSQEYWNSFLNSLSPHRPCHHQFKLTMRLCHNFHFLSAVITFKHHYWPGLGYGLKAGGKTLPRNKAEEPRQEGMLAFDRGCTSLHMEGPFIPLISCSCVTWESNFFYSSLISSNF